MHRHATKKFNATLAENEDEEAAEELTKETPLLSSLALYVHLLDIVVQSHVKQKKADEEKWNEIVQVYR